MRRATPMQDRRRLMTALCGGLLLPFSGAGWSQSPTPSQRDDRARQWFTDTSLEDQDGKRHLFYSGLIEPRAVLINAVFVGCTSACPLLTQHLASVRDRLGDRFGRDIWFLSITVDPLNDGPKELKRFAQRQGVDAPGWRFLTGAPAEVQAVTERLGLWVKDPEAHQTGLIAGHARSGRWSKLRPDSSPQALVQQLGRFIGPT